MASSDFRRADIIRAQQCVAGHCSNPACTDLTIGPSSDGANPSILGDAAHIYGRQPGSARYRQDMTDEQRRSPSNLIWLCACAIEALSEPIARKAGEAVAIRRGAGVIDAIVTRPRHSA